MKLKSLGIALLSLAMLTTVSAITVAFNGPNGGDLLLNTSTSVGTIINGVQGQYGGQVERDVYMVNNLITVPPGTFVVNPNDKQEYHRTTNGNLMTTFATATNAIAASGAGLAMGMNANGAIISVVLPAGYTYLVAAYDGPNGGVIVYDIRSFAAGTVIELAQFARPEGLPGSQLLVQDTGQYGLTGWTLLQSSSNPPPPPPPPGVPDSGSTISLIGLALMGIEFLRRKMIA
jgi:hypothetical protein